MAEGFKPLMIGALLAAIYFVSIVSFMGIMADNTNSSINIQDNPAVNLTFGNVTLNLTNTQTLALNQSQSQDSNKPIALFDFLFESIIGAGKVFKGIISGLYNIFFGFIASQLGIPDVIMYSMSAIVLILLILFAWRLWKTGQ